MAMLSRKHNSPVRCVVALLSASNSEFSETRGMASFYLLLYTVAQKHEVIRAVTKVL